MGRRARTLGLDTRRIEQLTGAKWQLDKAEGVFKVSVPRTDLSVQAAGVRITPPLGLTAWAAFAGSDDNAVVDGDFAVTEDELQPVLKALLKKKINIVAIHQHMTHEEPRIIFFHYWGRGAAKDLAQAIKGGFVVGGLVSVSSPVE